jgi:phosphoribosylformylglycinamidine synthase
VRIEGTLKALALVDGRQGPVRRARSLPGCGARRRRGGPQRRLHGATPLAITNCLNFGNPERPEVMWQFAQSVRGIADACRAFETR